jgi:hypothetical protein
MVEKTVIQSIFHSFLIESLESSSQDASEKSEVSVLATAIQSMNTIVYVSSKEISLSRTSPE